jgi:uncharacterized circularly permuted ATP-grasp superfamily protein/uncharacterized alpha-E superfamily protein
MPTTNSIVAENPKATDEQFLTYHIPENVFDEMCVCSGETRPHWEYLLRMLKTVGCQELQQRCQEARHLLRDNGVTINIHDDKQSLTRPWALDLIPQLIPSPEWETIESQLIQRTQLLNLILADLYGERQVFQKGILPPELIYSHPSFLRHCDGIEPPGGQYHLPFYAADLAKTTEGEICVVGDRTQAPLGAGYTLENRIVLGRVLSSWFRDLNVRRLALFFHTMRNTLMSMAWRKSDDTRIVVLSAGPDDNTYFEHAFLANYLGYTLVQGSDLTVRDGRVWLKTLDGLQPVDVILRRIEDNFCDPLELRQDSALGVAGLLQVVRMKQVAIVNPLGSGILENPALMAFLPALAQHFLGEELQLTSAPTWWCGQPKERDYVLANLHRLVIKSTFHHPGFHAIHGELLDEPARQKLHDQILAQPYHFVGQEEISRSTIPVFTNDHLEARQMILRSFVVAGEDDYKVMPGGLTRVASSPYTPILFAQHDSISKDTWVLAEQPEQPLTLLSSAGQIPALMFGHAELPSRVAENLFWLGRYAERTENITRLLQMVLLHILEPANYFNLQNQASLHSLLRAVTHLTKTYPGFVGEGSEAHLDNPTPELLSILLDQKRPGSLAFNLQAFLYAGHSVRDRTSPDMKRIFGHLEEGLQVLYIRQNIALQKPNVKHEEILNTIFEELNSILTHLAGFVGLATENMTHGQGWRFMMIGRRLERAALMIPLLRTLLSSVSSEEAQLLEYLLTICDSLMTYRSRYRTQVQIQPALELLLFDEHNPRSLGFQLAHLQEYIQNLPRCDNVFARKRPEERLGLESLTRLRLANIEELILVDKTNNFRTQLDQLLVRLNHLLPALSDAITNGYFSHLESPQPLVRLTSRNSL